MSPAATPVTHIEVETIAFSPAVKPPASDKTLFLSGAGSHYHLHTLDTLNFLIVYIVSILFFLKFQLRVLGARGLEIQGKFVKFTAIGVYLEDEAVPLLAVKWKGKSALELTDSVEFFRDIVTGKTDLVLT